MAGSLGWYWWMTGRVVEGRRWLDKALLSSGEIADSTRAQALCYAGALKADLALLEESVSTYRKAADAEGLAFATIWLGGNLVNRGELRGAEKVLKEGSWLYEQLDGPAAAAKKSMVDSLLAWVRGDPDEAKECLREAAAGFTAVGDEAQTLMCVYSLGNLAEQRGEFGEATSSFSVASRLARDLELWRFEASILARLGTMAASRNSLDEAESLYSQALQLSQDLEFTAGIALALNGMAFCNRARGRLDDAAACGEQALALYRGLDLAYGAAVALGTLGFLAEERGDGEAARRLHLAGLEQARRIAGSLPRAVAVAGLAGAAAAAGDARTAALLLGVADRLRDSVPWPPPSRAGDIDRTSASASRSLGPSAFRRLVAQGRDTALEDVLERLN
jgi:tetratricopeptide (TPR) repeat protein